jgi:hypothetical protein
MRNTRKHPNAVKDYCIANAPSLMKMTHLIKHLGQNVIVAFKKVEHKLIYRKVSDFTTSFPNIYVMVQNCSLFRKLTCKQSDSSVGRAVVRYSEGLAFEFQSGRTFFLILSHFGAFFL